MKRLCGYFVFITGLFAVNVLADSKRVLELPESEIYLFAIMKGKSGFHFAQGKNISNHKGYDNQPFFTPKSQSILFTSQRDPYQTDIYEYFLKSKKTLQVTRTPEQEYTAKTSPDNMIISFVREGGDPNQSLWRMDRHSGKITWALKSLEPVGYYDWNHATGYIVLWIRYAFSLQLMQPDTGLSEFIVGNALPAAPQAIPGGREFSIIHRQMDQSVWIKAFDPKTRALRPLVITLGQSRDYAWMPSGRILMGDGSKLYIWNGSFGDEWQEAADLSKLSITKITRLAVSPDEKWLALVGN